MKDSYGRTIDYLRISITDRCNLRCRYCMPADIDKLPMPDILTFEEILEVVQSAARLGFSKIKLTGGEPLVRPGISELTAMIKSVPGIRKITMTTNGVLFSEYAEKLKEAGLDAVNISLDTLVPERFKQITGVDALPRVMDGIRAALDAGIRTKLNVVLQKGRNEDEWDDLLRLSEDLPLDVRFIEMMPIGAGRDTEGVANDGLLSAVMKKYPGTERDDTVHGNGPAVYYHIPGFEGSVGFISAIHGKFCDRCNRIRMTSTGKLKPCLCYADTVDLKRILRGTADDTQREREIAEAIARAVNRKPEAHCFERLQEITEEKRMVEIGG